MVLAAVLLLILTLFTITLYIYNFLVERSKLPPGPAPIPIIGNILQLGKQPHRSFAKLSKTYGPLMYLKLGSTPTFITSSPETVKAILQKHDQTLSSYRLVPHVAHAMDHHEASMAWLPVGTKWRLFRKISREHMFTRQSMEASEGLRQGKLQQLRDYLEECCSRGAIVDLEVASFVTVLNMISSTLFSLDLARLGSGSDSTNHQMKESVYGIMTIYAVPNVADFFPFLRFLDPQGLKRKSEAYFRHLLGKFHEIITKRMQDKGRKNHDMLQLLLDIHRENHSDLTLHDINHLLIDLLTAGTDAASDSVEWAMAELLRNPEKMLKAKNELRSVIGDENEHVHVRESDIPRLPYLTAVIKETLRLHSPGPFLIPRKIEASVEINGYTIPRGALVVVNAWAMGRDPDVWSDPDSFEPERFLGSSIDYKGQDFEFIPFSSGRRICPGMPLAHLMVHLTLASMIHNFDWKLELGIKPEDIDMDDVFGLSLHKAVPLKAFPIRR